MVWLTRFDGTQFVLNGDLIETIEATPDTVIRLTNGHHFVVRESIDAIMRQVIEFRHLPREANHESKLAEDRGHTGLGEQA